MDLKNLLENDRDELLKKCISIETSLKEISINRFMDDRLTDVVLKFQNMSVIDLIIYIQTNQVILDERLGRLINSVNQRNLDIF